MEMFSFAIRLYLVYTFIYLQQGLYTLHTHTNPGDHNANNKPPATDC